MLFDSIKITKHSDIGKYKYRGYGLGFDPKEPFHIQQVVLVITLLFLVWMQVVLFMLPIELTTLS